MKLIGVSGKMGSGKDHITGLLIKHVTSIGKRAIQISFADHMKVSCISTGCVNYDSVFVNKTKESRLYLQKYGRSQRAKNPRVFIDQLDAWVRVHASRGIDYIFVADTRFKNELDYIRSRDGKVLRIEAPQRNKKRLLDESGGDTTVFDRISSDPSECDLDSVPRSLFDGVVENDEGDLIDWDRLYHVLDLPSQKNEF